MLQYKQETNLKDNIMFNSAFTLAPMGALPAAGSVFGVFCVKVKQKVSK